MSSSPKLPKPEPILSEDEWVQIKEEKISSLSSQILQSSTSTTSLSSTNTFTSEINSFTSLSQSINALTSESPLPKLNFLIKEKEDKILHLSKLLKKLKYSQCLHELHSQIINSTNTTTTLECFISLCQLKPQMSSKRLFKFHQQMMDSIFGELNCELEGKLSSIIESFPVLEIENTEEFICLVDQYFLLSYHQKGEDLTQACKSLLDLFILPLRRTFLFHYHHQAGRPTSSIEHPEWPLRYIKDCLFDNYDFLLLLSPMNRFDYPIPTTPFILIFIRRLLVLVVEVFQARLIFLSKDDPLIIRMIEESFKFLVEMRPLIGDSGYVTVDGYDPTLPLVDLFFPSLIGDSPSSPTDFLSPFMEDRLSRVMEGYSCLKEDSSLTRSFPILINSQLEALFELPNNAIIRSLYWKQVLIPLWDCLFKDLDENLFPSNNDNAIDPHLHHKGLSSTLKELDEIVRNITIQWNTSNEMELIASTEFKSLFDSTETIPEYLFGGKVLIILKRIIKAYKNEILKWIWEEYMRNGAIGWSRGMVYAIQTKEERASDLIKSMNILEKCLLCVEDADVRGAIVRNCSLFVFESVILQNYYRGSGIGRFSNDIIFFKQRIEDIFPSVQCDWAKIDSSLLIITSPPSFRNSLLNVMHTTGAGTGGESITDELASVFNGIFEALSIEECGKIISLCK